MAVMSETYPRSPYDREGGIVYFPRMLDKIRLRREGRLPEDYHENMGEGFDRRCCAFLHVDYTDVVARVEAGDTDAEVLEWCCAHGRRPSEEEIFVWSEFLRKCGWNDQLSGRLRTRLEGLGMAGRRDVQTMFDLLEVDEGRAPGGAGA
jgi:gluconokinase